MAAVVVERRRLLCEVRDHNIEEAAVIVVAKIHSHRSLGAAIAAKRASAEHACVRKGAIVIVVIEVVRGGIVGHVQVWPAVIIIVAPRRTQTVIQVGVAHPRFLGNILKGAIAAIAKEEMAFSYHAPGAALDGDPLEMAKLGAPELGKMVHIDVHITRDEQIHVAIAVVVGPGGAGAEAAHANSSLCRYIFECAVAFVAIEHVAAVAGDIKVQQSIIVKIGNRHSHAPALAGQAGFLRNIGELQVGVLVIQGYHAISALAITVHG